MPDPTDRLEQNVPGAWYVTHECIDCDLCRDVAAGHFVRNEEAGYSFVARQPTTEEQTALCAEAMEDCPVEAIGNDGAEG